MKQRSVRKRILSLLMVLIMLFGLLPNNLLVQATDVPAEAQVDDLVVAQVGGEDVQMELYDNGLYEVPINAASGSAITVTVNGEVAGTASIDGATQPVEYIRYNAKDKSVYSSVTDSEKFIQSATWVGQLDSVPGLGLKGWDQADTNADLNYIGGGIFSKTFAMPPLQEAVVLPYDYKITFNHNWSDNAIADTDKKALTLPIGTENITIYTNAFSKYFTDSINNPEISKTVSLIGSVRETVDMDWNFAATDWDFTRISNEYYVYSKVFETASRYEYKCVYNHTNDWYKPDGNIELTTTKANQNVVFLYDVAEKKLYDSINDFDKVSVALGFKEAEVDPELDLLKSPVINNDGTITFNYIGKSTQSVIVKGLFNNWKEIPMEMKTTEKGNTYFVTTVDVTKDPGIYPYGFNDNNEKKWLGDPLNKAYYTNNSNKAFVRNPIETDTGTIIYYPTTEAGAKLQYRKVGETEYKTIIMEEAAAFSDGMYSATVTEAGTYEYYIEDPQGNNIGDPNNFVTEGTTKTFEVNEIDNEIANLKSPVINGTSVTFNYYDKAATQVRVAGSFTGWQANALSMKKSDKGIWSVTHTLEPGVYQYKFIKNVEDWITDPKNNAKLNGNSAFYVEGLTLGTTLDIKKGQATALPNTGKLYTSLEAQEVAVIYTLSEEDVKAGVTITEGKITIPTDYTNTTLALKVTSGLYEYSSVINIVDKLYTYNFKYYHSDENYSDKDIWIFGDGIDGSPVSFTGDIKDAKGRKWATATTTFKLDKADFIIRTGGSKWTAQEADRSCEIPIGAESADIWVASNLEDVFTEEPDELVSTNQRYVILQYVREDGDYSNWNVYTWIGGDRYIDFDENGIALVPVNRKTSQLDFVIRKGYPASGEEWVKDGGDCSVKIPLNQKIVKGIVTSGQTSNIKMLPYNSGYTLDGNNKIIHFTYRDDNMFKDGTLDTLAEISVEVNGTKYPMTYNSENERYEYDYKIMEDGQFLYCYHVKETADSEVEVILDKYNDNVVDGKSAIEFQDINADITATVQLSSINYKQNAVLSVNIKNEAGETTLIPSEAYVDLSSLGGDSKVYIETDLMEISIGVTEATKYGKKQIPVTVVDQYGKKHVVIVSVNVVAPTINNNDFDWDEAVIYFMLTDRFKDGNTTNNDAYGVGDYNIDPETGCSSYHGGDFAGVTSELDYLKDLGINTIWITPIVENITESQTSKEPPMESYGYHGYWTSNFEELNKHLGTEAELRELISEAHSRGIKIMVDIVINHAGYGTEETFEGMFRDKNVSGDTILDSLAGLPDFATEKEEVRNKLIEWQTAWMEGYDIDYFRVDTVKHVETTTWAAFKNSLTKANPEFKLIGEYAGAGTTNDFDYLNTGMMDSLLNFDFNNMATDFVNGKLEEVEAQLEAANTMLTNTGTVGNFLGSHDEDGFIALLEETKTKEVSKNLAKIAATLQMTAKGQPVIYYGEELGQSGLNNYPYQTNRYDFDWSIANNENSMYTHYKQLLKVRNDNTKVFAKGSRKTVVGSNADGFLVMEREYNGKKALVGFNLNDTEKEVTINVGTINSKTITDQYNVSTYAVDSNNNITFTIPAVQDGGTAILTYEAKTTVIDNGGSGSQGNSGDTGSTTNLTSNNWSDVKKAISEAVKNTATSNQETTITIEMKDSTTIPVEILSLIINTNINLVLNMKEYSWTISAKDIDTKEWLEFEKNNKVIDLLVTKITDKDILAGMDKALDTNKGLYYIDIKHDGAIPFNAVLNYHVGEEYAGTSLFYNYYNEKEGKVKPIGYAKVNEKGYMKMSFSHFSKYVITVENKVLPSVIKTKTLYISKTYNLQSKIENLLKDDYVFFKSSNKSIATISDEGKITAKKAGKVTITTQVVQNGKIYTYKTQVVVKKPYIKITTSKKTIKVGESFTFKSKVYGESSNITYSVSDTKIATINKKTGKLKAKKAGKVVVTVKAGNITKKFTVVVTK